MLATRQSWSNVQPLPDQYALLFLQRKFTAPEYERLRQGLIPRAMEDKWFIFLEENTLYFHRSWTGYCIYQIDLTTEGANYAIGDVFVNRDESQYSGTDDRYDEKLLMYLIDSLLLGGQSPLPIATNLPAGIATELHLHHAVGAGHKEEETPKEVTILGMLRWFWQWLLWLIKS